MLFKFFLVVHAIIAVSLVGVILLQRSEGGGLAGGGSPAGLVSARGAADLLTRTTAILGTIFILLSIGLAALATMNRAPRELDTSLSAPAPVGAPAAPVAPVSSVPLADTQGAPAAVAPKAEPKLAEPKAEVAKPVAAKPAAPKVEAKVSAPKVETPAPVAASKAEAPAAPTQPE